MWLQKKFNKKTGIYRSKDTIENFHFRIKLKGLNSFVKVPKFNAEQLNEADDLDKIEYEDFYWQQKRFNTNELDIYRKLDNCKTDAQKRFHQQILNSENGENGYVRNSRIFSYVMDDKFTPPLDETDDSANYQLVQNVDNFGEWSESTDGGKTLVDSTDTQVIRSRYKNLGQFDVMYIMAELEEEVILAIIKYRVTDGLLLVYPDFNDIDHNPYIREIDADSRHIYQFCIENLSDERRQPDWSLKQDLDKLASKLSDLSIKSSAIFATPPRNQTHICLCLEIESADKFSYDHIHVKFRFIIPNNCNVIDGEIDGSTHSSWRQRYRNGCWLIGFCHELNVLCEHDYQFDEHPKIVFEIVSIDWWGRERTEGYAMTTIPLKPGKNNECITFYRDLGDDTWYDWLERYFIGGRRKVLLDEFYANTNEKVTLLNRYGNKTETTGILNIRWNIIMQKASGPSAKTSIMMKNKPNNRRHAAITNVLDAYREARERLEDIIKPC